VREVIDGQQRLAAIVNFFDNEISLPKSSANLGLAGRTFNTLPTKASDRFEEYSLDFSVISDADDSEVRTMFLRLQMGVRLNAAEELNAVAGGMRNYVNTVSALTLFSSRAAFSDARGAHRQVAAQSARLAIAGFGDVRKKDLLEFFASHANCSPDAKAKLLRQVIEWLGTVFDERDPFLRNRGQTVPAIYAIYSLWPDAVFAGQESAVKAAFRHLDEEIVGDGPEVADYRLALAHSSDQKRSLEVRHHTMLDAIARWAPKLPRRDAQRLFSPEERAAILYRDGGLCQAKGCGLAVDFASFHADHVVAWTKGGATVLANAQVLCAVHNLAKGSS
jgi:hypothetical protein